MEHAHRLIRCTTGRITVADWVRYASALSLSAVSRQNEQSRPLTPDATRLFGDFPTDGTPRAARFAMAIRELLLAISL